MNRKLLVTLLHKNLEELNVITEGFMEMDEYPAAIIHLAKRKTEDIQIIIDQLSAEMGEKFIHNKPYINVDQELVQENIELTKPTETVVVEVEETVLPENNAPVKIQTESIDKEIVIREPEIMDPLFDTIEDDLAPELILVEEEIEDLPEIVEELEIMDLNESLEEKHEELIIKEEVPEIQNLSVLADTDDKKPATEDHKRAIIAEKIIQPTVSRNEILAKGDNSLSASIANKKIADIKQAISIGDRFRFQRELFKGNGEEMNRTLNYINQLATFDEASSFLMSKYSWDKANESVEDFLQIVRRRF